MPPLLVLRARAEARALLFALGELSWEAAIAPLLDYAEEWGLVEEVGGEAVVEVIRAGFNVVFQSKGIATL